MVSFEVYKTYRTPEPSTYDSFSALLLRVYLPQKSKILGPTVGHATAWAVNSPINWYITYHWYEEYI